MSPTRTIVEIDESDDDDEIELVAVVPSPPPKRTLLRKRRRQSTFTPSQPADPSLLQQAVDNLSPYLLVPSKAQCYSVADLRSLRLRVDPKQFNQLLLSWEFRFGEPALVVVSALLGSCLARDKATLQALLEHAVAGSWIFDRLRQNCEAQIATMLYQGEPTLGDKVAYLIWMDIAKMVANLFILTHRFQVELIRDKFGIDLAKVVRDMRTWVDGFDQKDMTTAVQRAERKMLALKVRKARRTSFASVSDDAPPHESAPPSPGDEDAPSHPFKVSAGCPCSRPW